MVASADNIARVREFSRFYTRVVGALDEGHLHSDFSLTEVRVMFELAHRESTTAQALARDLSLDPGYLSRLLGSLTRRRLIKRATSAADKRESNLSLTVTGKRAFATLEERANQRVGALLAPLDATRQASAVSAMQEIRELLDDETRDQAPSGGYMLRSHEPGDMGWVIHRHGALYYREYGWDERFEALVAHICADFIDGFDKRRERCWIAELKGMAVGCVFLVKHPEREGVAKLRLLLVEPSARGHGIGKRLVAECTRFARQAGYRAITLWTNDVLASARRLYEAEGYLLVTQDTHHSFGHDLIGQNWELPL